jgi:WD40-like Beta Propeller Repeat
MIRLLPRTLRGTWLLAGAVWLAGVGALWWALPYRPRAAWQTQEPAVVHGFIPGTKTLLTSSSFMPNELGRPTDPVRGPLLARDAETGEVEEWFPDVERLTLVDPGVDGRYVLVGRVLFGRARLCLHDARRGGIVAELPQADERDDPLPTAIDQFAAFRPDGRQVVYSDRVGGRRCLRIWDVDSGKKVMELPDAGPPAAWSADGRVLAFASRSRGLSLGSLQLWDGSTRRSRAFRSFEPLTEEFEQLAFSPDGQTLVAVTQDQKAGVGRRACLDQVIGWEVATGREKYRRDAVWAGLSRGLPWFATADLGDGGVAVHRYDYASGSPCGELGQDGSLGPGTYGISPDGSLVIGSRRHSNPILEFLNQYFPGKVPPRSIVEWPQIVETATDRPLYLLPMTLDRECRSRSATGWSQDDTLLAIAGEDTLAVWDMPPRKSVTWFAAATLLVAVATFAIARWRIRRLRREVAA